jgi:ABC-type sugar transport system substrate-binding protein
MQLRSSLAALLPLALCLLPPAALAEDEETVSVFLPNYSEKWWSDMHGSVISEDDEKTEYTIFCPKQTPQRCNLAGDTPFTFTEGPETLIFHGTLTST